MKICLAYAHTKSGKGSGAIGVKNESIESRKLTNEVYTLLKNKHDVDIIGVDFSNDYLHELVKKANTKKYDLVVQIHFNSYNKNVNGTETFYHENSSEGEKYANQVNNKLKTIFKNRGAKPNNTFYWLKNTIAPAILIETCFIDNKHDMGLYDFNFKKIAKLIAEGLINENLDKKYNLVVGQTSNINLLKKIQSELKNDNIYSIIKEV